MRLAELKISLNSSGEDELVRNPSSSSVLLQRLDFNTVATSPRLHLGLIV